MSRIAPGSNVHDVSAATARDRRKCAVQPLRPSRDDRSVPPPPIAAVLQHAAELAVPTARLACRGVAELAVPTACLACRGPAGRAGEALCPACRRALPWLREAPRA